MKLTKIILLTFTLIISSLALARNPIRTLYTSDKVIKPVFLSLGRSTLLKFKDKPEKVVIGNKNYHNLEYINNDVTIQPLGAFDTNLFVYTKNKRTYSFLLKVVPKNKYDDVVHVRWKNSYQQKKVPRTKVKKQLKFPVKSLRFKDGLEVLIEGVHRTHMEKSYVLHLSLRNNSEERVQVKDLSILLTRGKKKIDFQKLFFLNDSIPAKRTSKARIFVGLKILKGLSVNIGFKKEKRKTIISRKYL